MSAFASRLTVLRVLLPLCVAVPLTAYVAVGAYRYTRVFAEAAIRLDRTLKIAHEHALKVLETGEALLNRVEDLVELGDATLLSNRERALHEQLQSLARGKSQLQGLFVISVDGKLRINSRVYPSPDVDISDRESFRWHREGRGGVFVSARLVSRTTHEPFFDLVIARRNIADAFNGVISCSLSPPYFERFHSELVADEPGLAINLFREDGSILARTPAVEGAPAKLSTEGPVMTRIRTGRIDGAANGVSSVDGRDRLISFRKLADYPLYVGAGIGLAHIRSRWAEEMAWLLAFGVPPFLGLFLTVRLALKRTREALDFAEAQRRDAEALHRAENALSQTRKLEALGRLTGGVAHDFNNALMVLNNNLFLLRRKAPDVATPHIEAMARAIASATQLTRQLLRFSSRQAQAPQTVTLQTALPELATVLTHALRNRAELSIRVEPTTSQICVEPSELEAALLNLTLNACDSMPHGGTVTITARNVGSSLPAGLQGRFVVIDVGDTGSGIEPANLLQVFEPFFTTKPIGHGTGLGLSQVYGMCKRNGGIALLHSVVGRGTTVSLYLPVSVAEPARTAMQQPSTDVSLDMSVLLVEDNEDLASSLAPLLQSLGCKVTHFGQATDALAWLHAAHSLPDLLLTDVVMPGDMDGGALAMTTRGTWPKVQVILMSGFAINYDGLAEQGFVILTKPCSAEMLARALRESQGTVLGESQLDQ